MNPVVQQTVPVGGTGADSRRVLDALTPVNGVAAPAVNAKFLGQIFVDEQAGKVFISIAVDSETPADDWQEQTPAAAFNAAKPLSGAAAPAVNATFLGQLYVETTTPAFYMAKAVGSAVKADDWQKLANAVG